jgi:hypothetical protein
MIILTVDFFVPCRDCGVVWCVLVSIHACVRACRDNRSTMHRRLPFDGDRLLWRTQSRGDKPI